MQTLSSIVHCALCIVLAAWPAICGSLCDPVALVLPKAPPSNSADLQGLDIALHYCAMVVHACCAVRIV